MSNGDKVEKTFRPLRVWSFCVPYKDDRYLVDGFNNALECYSSRDELLWQRKFDDSSALREFINREFPTLIVL